MTKKFRRLRAFARTASKLVEKKIIENSEKIKENPYLIIPYYDDKYSQKCFDRLRKRIEKVVRFENDNKKLEGLSRKKGLEGALAGTFLVANSKKTPYLAVAKFYNTEITFAQRGKADPEKLIALQHFDNPIFRLLTVKDIALKKGLNVYSWDNGFVSTGISPNPPKDFIDFVLKKTGLFFEKEVATCKDLSHEIVKDKKSIEKNYMSIHWRSAGIILAICENCARAKRNNTVFEISKYLIEPELSNDISVFIVDKFTDGRNFGDVKYLNDYLLGKLNDIDLIEKNVEDRTRILEKSGEKLFILDGISYGKDMNRFIEKLNPNQYEKIGLEMILSKINEAIIFDNATPNKVLERYWRDHGFEVILSIVGEEEIAKKLYSIEETPSNLIEIAFNYKQRRQILSTLPVYKSLPPLAKFADDVARAYRVFGMKRAILEAYKHPTDTKGKAIAYAFLLIFGKGQDKKWQYSQIEIEYGEFLKDYAKRLLYCEPKYYHDALKELLINSGSTEEIDSCLIKK